jgi:branched-chain amino acid aminotransferase
VVDFDVCLNDRPMSDVEREDLLTQPPFGQVFTDHMITLRWTKGRGWHDGRLEPYAALTLPPAASVFHYGQAIFEGMKAYRHDSGTIGLFRPLANAERFNRSARRLAMPELPVDTFLHAVELLVTEDRAWVPESGDGKCLYLRPFMIATQPGLGFTHPSSSYLFCVIASPAAPYFGASGPTALTVWLSEEYVRAAPGGTGAAKAAGNYAGAFVAGRQATAQGCDQVVWLDAAKHTWVEEMGGMNIFFVYGATRQRILTPALTGALLPGVTRDSLLTLAGELGIDAEEGQISTTEWRQQCAAGEMTEAFACGTAAVIAPIGAVKSRSGGWQVGDGRPGPVTGRLREELLAIQYGRGPDPFHWVHKVC